VKRFLDTLFIVAGILAGIILLLALFVWPGI
jgi:hypothetical protein